MSQGGLLGDSRPCQISTIIDNLKWLAGNPYISVNPLLASTIVSVWFEISVHDVTVIFKVGTWTVWVLCYGTLDLRSTSCLGGGSPGSPFHSYWYLRFELEGLPFLMATVGVLAPPLAARRGAPHYSLPSLCWHHHYLKTRLDKVLALHWLLLTDIWGGHSFFLLRLAEHRAHTVLPRGGRDMAQW